jgi:hypothetical protein
MSWLDDLVDFGSSVVDWFTGSSVGANIARTAVTGYALNRVTASINKENEKPQEPDPGVRLQVDPDPDHKIPVVYGKAFIGGILTEAILSSDNQKMYYVLTLCERTGNTNLGAGAASVFTFKSIYWNDQKLTFDADGITVAAGTDRDGNVDTSLDGFVKVYCYAGNSSLPVVPTGYTNAGLTAAYTVLSNGNIPVAQRWTANHTMNDLVFAIVEVTYNKENRVIGIGNMTFEIENSMKQAGDCIYDYMTNTRYGAGIPATEINSI